MTSMPARRKGPLPGSGGSSSGTTASCIHSEVAQLVPGLSAVRLARAHLIRLQAGVDVAGDIEADEEGEDYVHPLHVAVRFKRVRWAGTPARALLRDLAALQPLGRAGLERRDCRIRDQVALASAPLDLVLYPP